MLDFVPPMNPITMSETVHIGSTSVLTAFSGNVGQDEILRIHIGRIAAFYMSSRSMHMLRVTHLSANCTSNQKR